jgi:hypothetical protein
MKNCRLPTPEEIEELTAFLPLLYADDFESVQAWGPQGTTSLSSPIYEDLVGAFFHLLGKEPWSDSEYLSRKPGRMLDDRDVVAHATLEEVRTMLTFCKRGENFCSGWWESKISNGQVRWLLERLIELNGEGR